jgi:hypothetical protein
MQTKILNGIGARRVLEGLTATHAGHGASVRSPLNCQRVGSSAGTRTFRRSEMAASVLEAEILTLYEIKESAHHQTAVHVKVGPCNIGGLIGSQKSDGRSDFIGCTQATEWGQRKPLFPTFLEQIGKHLCFDTAGRDEINCNPILPEFAC